MIHVTAQELWKIQELRKQQPNFFEQRRSLFESINPILETNNSRFLVDNDMVHLLLYGNVTFKLEENQSILKATINFIRKTTRFSQF